VIHAATEASAKLNEEDPLRMIDTIVTGTRQTLDFAVETGARRFLLTSSGAVYGAQPHNVTHLSEEYTGGPDSTSPRSAYGESKRLAELLCACYAGRGIESVIARCFAFVGPYLPIDTHFAIGNFIRDGLSGGPIKIGGDGTPFRSYLYAADLAVWLWTLLFRGQPGLPYNVGSEEDVTILRLAQTVARCFRDSIEITVAQEPRPGVPPSRYVPSARRAAGLGLGCRIPLAEAISRTIAWHSPSSTPAHFLKTSAC
jgi:dTDP-glucose 4,6-dehydratase